MLNRRLLRIKAMQALYAYQQAKQAHLEIAQDKIKQKFLPDLNAMEKQDTQLLKKQAQIALDWFLKSYTEKELKAQPQTDEKIRKAVFDAIQYYYTALQNEQKNYLQNMIAEAEQIYDSYLQALLFGVELMRFTAQLKEKRQLTAFIPKDLSIYQLSENKILNLIAQNKTFQDFIIRRKISIDDETLKTFWQEWKEDETYLNYCQNYSASWEQDWQVVDYLYRHYLFHKEADEDNPEQKNVFKAFFEENDLNWIENREILKSLILKTLKKAKENPEQFELLTLSTNWQDDKDFFKDLFEKTLQESEQLEKRIAQKTENWESDRLFQTDKILILMGLTEMIHCPSIPVKVTINEYVELAKSYSTPKSKIFVNGLLDKISKELLQEGIIRKSGKGLLDNR